MNKFAENIVQLAKDEGKDVALDEAQKIQLALEDLGILYDDPTKVQIIRILLKDVCDGIEEVLELKVQTLPQCGCGVETPHKPGESFCYGAHQSRMKTEQWLSRHE